MYVQNTTLSLSLSLYALVKWRVKSDELWTKLEIFHTEDLQPRSIIPETQKTDSDTGDSADQNEDSDQEENTDNESFFSDSSKEHK